MPRPRRNRLLDEPSLYLRQHSANPVDWYPWCDDALTRARHEDLPILLSVGYSACHWCHVMERECFEDETIAALMNDLFVCIKVDREERPDIDGTYMRAVQAMTGRGGWPMTVFLTPELLPFYAGTYFPPVDRRGLPGFSRVLRAVASAYRSQRDRVQRTGERISQALRLPAASDVCDLDRDAIRDASLLLERSMDRDFGGFGTAPKFPAATCIGFQIGAEWIFPHVERRRLIGTTLDAMAAGGMYDQLGGGFHRHSVDRAWRVPHFEKMLYDQALMVDLYRDAWLAFRNPRYRDVALSTLGFVRREMRSAGGAFFATQDADSEGREGRYFTWSGDEIRAAAGPRDADIALDYFGATGTGDFDGENVLRVDMPVEVIARNRSLPETEVVSAIDRVRRELLRRRALRVPPNTDRKILADWNGLMIAAMTASGRVFRRPDLVQTASEAADHVLAVLWPDARLFHFHDVGKTRVGAFLDDYAFLGRALLELYAATRQPCYFDAAQRCAEALLDRYEDKEAGGFFFTPEDGVTIFDRQKMLQDGAAPAGNSIAADLLFRLYALTGEGRYESAADRAVAVAAASAIRSPYHGASLLGAALRRTVGYTTVVIFEPPGSSTLLETALDVYLPGLTVLASAPAVKPGEAPLVSNQQPRGGVATAYVCRGGACGLPVHTIEELHESLVEVAACGV